MQNRVNPWGEICVSDARGTLTGNRGIIHDPETKALLKRRWNTKAWIICVCDFQGRRRDVMGRNGRNGRTGWTELFFLDEVTALAAGHRPCFFCQRERATEFAERFGPALKAPQMDAILHRERLASGGKLVALPPAEVFLLPDGVMVEHGELAFAVRSGQLFPWEFHGYGPRVKITSMSGGFRLITPVSTLAALRKGYLPAWHFSAAA